MSPLKGLHRWMTVPSTWSGVAGVVLAVVYLLFTLELVEGTRLAFAFIVAAVVVIANVLGDVAEQRRLLTLKALGLGTLPPTRENLIAALREAARLPDITFWVNLFFWAPGCLVISVLYALLPRVTWSMSSRIAFIGGVVGPMISVLAHLLVLARSRTVRAAIATQGLTTTDVMQALPPERTQLRTRLVIFTAVAVAMPLVLVLDLGQLDATRAVDQLLLTGVAPTGYAAGYNLVVAVFTFVLVIGCGWLGGRSLGDPLHQIVVATERMAKGQLGKTAAVPSEDELWGVSTAFASMENQLLGALQKLKGAGVKISSTTEELIASSVKHEAGAADQTGALSQTSATTEELARSAKQIAQNASDVSRLAQQMLDTAQHGKRSSNAFYASILRVREGNQAIADSVVRLNKRVQQVGRIVEFIDGIADKSDLLALNAELEGTKAGDVGRGFSLVAAEMRRLSESVMSSTREINRLIDEIRDATNAAVMATEAGVKATDAGSALARQVNESLDRIVDFANQTTDAVKAITLATLQQQSGTDQLASAMADILRSTQSALGATAQMSSANADLSSLSNELQSTVARFEVSR
ncbi:MAG: methyl-accepting chemotaxis protein [Archangiaceae bacterium]|nr:methyl-accepting chemotaxis protein [Archangiaceae bacterium]